MYMYVISLKKYVIHVKNYGDGGGSGGGIIF